MVQISMRFESNTPFTFSQSERVNSQMGPKNTRRPPQVQHCPEKWYWVSVTFQVANSQNFGRVWLIYDLTNTFWFAEDQVRTTETISEKKHHRQSRIYIPKRMSFLQHFFPMKSAGFLKLDRIFQVDRYLVSI